MADLKKFLTKNEDGALEALGKAFSYGQIDGSHHKTWTIDQMVRALTGENYNAFIEFYRFTPDGEAPAETQEVTESTPPVPWWEEEREEIYSWDEGIAP